MRLNNKSIMELDVSRNSGAAVRLLGRSLEKLSSGYCVNSAGDGSVVLISQRVRVENHGLPQLIRSSGARRAD